MFGPVLELTYKMVERSILSLLHGFVDIVHPLQAAFTLICCYTITFVTLDTDEQNMWLANNGFLSSRSLLRRGSQ